MMPALTVANVVTWAIQVTVIVALAAVLPRLVWLTSARALGWDTSTWCCSPACCCRSCSR